LARRRRWGGIACAVIGLAAALCACSALLGQATKPQLRVRPKLGRDRALDVLAYFRPGLKPEEMAVLDFDKSIGFFQGWDPRIAVLCIKDDELKFPAERAPIFLFVTSLDLTDYEGAFGGLRKGIYAAVASGGDDTIAIHKFAARNTVLQRSTTKKSDMSREYPEPRYFVQQARGGGGFTLHAFIGKSHYEWLLLDPKPEKATETTP
jgi:hypothetical protein